MSKIFCIFYSYIIIAFICMDYNPVNWDEFNRVTFVFVALMWIMLMRIMEKSK